MCYYHLLCNLRFLLLYRMFFVHGYVMLCKSVCASVTTWFLCTLLHGSLVPDVTVLCFVLG